MEYCSIEDAWGDDFCQPDHEHTEEQQYSKYGPSMHEDNEDYRVNNNYMNSYCNSIINHVQGCTYCQSQLKRILSGRSFKDVVESLPASILDRNNDNLAFIPFGLEPEVFNILLFSTFIIMVLFFIDKDK